jgi:uncharacterized membrane protein
MLADIIIILIYSFLASVMEQARYLFSGDKKVVANIITGFPLYAIGAYLIVFINKYIKHYNIFTKLILFTIVLVPLEYVTGILVNAGMTTESGHVQSWDYNSRMFNYKGILSLETSVGFGVLALIVSYMHPVLKRRIQCAIDCS